MERGKGIEGCRRREKGFHLNVFGGNYGEEKRKKRDRKGILAGQGLARHFRC
jgi:hypothetical protein